MPEPVVTRFAPSPTGFLHLGHAYSALFARDRSAQVGGRFLLRLEDIDITRCRREFEDAIYEDLAWLGLDWEVPVRRQSRCFDDYEAALAKLDDMGLLYPCFCTRRQIQIEIHEADGAPHLAPDGPDGPVYPGTCRDMDPTEREIRKARGDAFALRLDMARAIGRVGNLEWTDIDRGRQRAVPQIFGDVVLARKDVPTSYHLAVTVDDDLQGVNLVTRGRDLFEATHVHRLLQALLGLRVPIYHHHALLVDGMGKRFAKRDKALTIRSLRDAGETSADVVERVYGMANRGAEK